MLLLVWARLLRRWLRSNLRIAPCRSIALVLTALALLLGRPIKQLAERLFKKRTQTNRQLCLKPACPYSDSWKLVTQNAKLGGK